MKYVKELRIRNGALQQLVVNESSTMFFDLSSSKWEDVPTVFEVEEKEDDDGADQKRPRDT